MAGPTARVSRRLRTLAVLELVNVGVIGWAFFGAMGAPPSAPNLAGYLLTAIHLVVGAAYWASKLHQIQRGLRRPPGAGTLRPVGRALALLLLAGAALLAYGVATLPIGDWAAGVVLYVLAVAEHVNYFHRQLMHDNSADIRRLARTGRFPRSHLRSDASAER